MIRLAFTIIAGVLLGLIVHLVAVLALPRIATHAGQRRSKQQVADCGNLVVRQPPQPIINIIHQPELPQCLDRPTDLH